MKEIVLREGFIASDIPEDIADLMNGRTYHTNPDIQMDDLAYLRVRHLDFDHNESEGELVVHRALAAEVLEIFAELFDCGYEIEKLRLCDHYYGDDESSMADNNSSAFNYRTVADTDTLSLHALGRAVDINPLYNPYIVGDKCMPENGLQFEDRTPAFPHKIDHEDICFKIFSAHGWLWGGDWRTEKDYQHFYKPLSTPAEKALDFIKSVLHKK